MNIWTDFFHQKDTSLEQLKYNKVSDELRNFRSFDEISKLGVTNLGIDGHYLSGSGQFTAKNISQIRDRVKEVAKEVNKIIIIDVRMERHGFDEGLPVEWKKKLDFASLNKSLQEIIDEEKEKLKILKEEKKREVLTEESVVAKNEFDYVRLPTLDHSHPSNEMVDKFLELIKNNPNTWIHIHCHVGKGRTTLFMILYDMFFNAKQLDFDKILERHKKNKGEDFLKYLSKPKLKAEKKELFENRYNFLKEFYRYCKDSDPKKVSWQEWLKPKNIKE